MSMQQQHHQQLQHRPQHHHGNLETDPPSDSQIQEMLGLADASLMNDFPDDLLSPDLDLDLASLPNPHIQSLQQSNESSLDSPGNQSSPVQQTIEDPSDDRNDDQPDLDADIDMSGVGAGPLPTGFGVQLPPSVGSTLTEFTKRRNWSQRVVEEIKDFLHVLTPDGRIMYASPSCEALTGYNSSQLVGKFMTSFLHQDDSGMFVREFNESIASGHPLRFFYRFRKPDDTCVIFESHGHPHFSSDVSNFGGSSHGVSFCRGLFMMARLYPARNAALLDSFLEHKIENERLKKRIADLKREEQDEMQQQYMAGTPAAAKHAEGRDSGSMTGSEAVQRARASNSGERSGSARPDAVPASPNNYNGMPPPAKPPVTNFALTRRNLDEALAASRPDSINDKMARYEAANHYEGIEMLTGLRFRDGERSKGISTGSKSPALVRGDQGIEYAVDRDGASHDRSRGYSGSPHDPERKKKTKVADEYVCTDCGTLDSPEWRRGPSGPKTLCNACGLRWAKKEKKRTSVSGASGTSGPSLSKQPDPNGTATSVPSPSSAPLAISTSMGGITSSAGMQPSPLGVTMMQHSPTQAGSAQAGSVHPSPLGTPMSATFPQSAGSGMLPESGNGHFDTMSMESGVFPHQQQQQQQQQHHQQHQ